MYKWIDSCETADECIFFIRVIRVIRGKEKFSQRPKDGSAFPHEIHNSFIVVGEKKRVGIEFQNVARPADDLAILKKAGYEVLQALALSHDNDLVSVADRLVCRAMQRNKKCILDSGGRVSVEKIEPKGRASGREKGIRSSHISAPFRTLEFRIGKDLAAGRMAIWPAVIGTVF